MESTNQYVQSFDREQFHLVVIFLKGAISQQKLDRVVADEVILMDLTDAQLQGLKLSALSSLYRLLKKLRPDVLICHRYHSIWLSGVISLFIRIPTCFAVLHGNKQLRRLGRRLFTRLLLRHRFYFVGISGVVREDLLASGSGLAPDRVFSMPNSIDIEAQKSSLLPRLEARKRLGVAPDHYVVGHVARMVSTKNQRHLLKSFAQAHQAVPESRLVLVGDGKLERELKELAADLALGEAVVFAGRVEKAADYMQAFDLFVVTSKNEGFGRVLLEAMMARCPIIATDIPAFSEVLCGSGTLVQVDDVPGLSRQIQEHHAMSTEQRQRILVDQDRVLYENYSLETFKHRFQNIYHTVLRNGRDSAAER